MLFKNLWPRCFNFFTFSILLFVYLCISGSGCDPSFDETSTTWHWVCRPAVLTDSFVGATSSTGINKTTYFRNVDGEKSTYFMGALIKERCYSQSSPRSNDFDDDDAALLYPSYSDPFLYNISNSNAHVIGMTESGRIYRIQNGSSDFPSAFKNLNHFMSSKHHGPTTSRKYTYRTSPRLAFDGSTPLIFAAAYAPGKTSNHSYLAKFKYSKIDEWPGIDTNYDRNTALLAEPCDVDFNITDNQVYLPAGSYLYHFPAALFSKSMDNITASPLSHLNSTSTSDIDFNNLSWRLGVFKKNIGSKVNPAANALGNTSFPGLVSAAFKISSFLLNTDADRNKITSTPELMGQRMFLTTETDILCIHKTGLLLLWSQPLKGSINNIISEYGITKGRKTVFAVPLTQEIYSAEGSFLVKRNAKNGSIIWKENLSSPLNSCPAYWHQKKILAQGTQDGKGHIIKSETGEHLFPASDFSNGSIYTTPYFDVSKSYAVFFTYGNSRGGVEKIDLQAGYKTLLPVALSMAGDIQYFTVPTFYAKITTQPEFKTSDSNNLTTFNKVEIKAGSPVTHTLKISPDPSTGTGEKTLSSYIDNNPQDPSSSGTPKDYAPIKNTLKSTNTYKEGEYTLTLTSTYTTPEGDPGVSSISTKYYISKPYTPIETLNNPFKSGKPPLQLRVCEIISPQGNPMLDKPMQVLQIDEDRNFSVNFSASFNDNFNQTKFLNELCDPRDEFYVGPVTNRGRGPAEARAASGIPYSPGQREIKMSTLCQNDQGQYTADNIVVNNFPLPSPGSVISVPRQWIFKLPTIPSKEFWANSPGEAGNFSSQVTERLLTAAISYKYQNFSSEEARSWTIVHKEYDEFDNLINEWEETFYIFRIYRSGTSWTAENPCMDAPLAISARDKTPPVLKDYPFNIEGNTGDPLQLSGITYIDNNTFDDKPLKFFIYLEKVDRNTLTGPPDSTWANHNAAQASFKSECYGVCPPSMGLLKELRQTGSINLASSAITPLAAPEYPEVILPTEYAGTKILRYCVVIEDNSGNINPGCTLVTDNHNPGSKYNLPSGYNHSLITDSNKTGYISVFDNDKPDIYLTIEPLSDSTILLQNLSKFEYTVKTDLQGDTVFKMTVKSLSIAGETTEEKTLTLNNGENVLHSPAGFFPSDYALSDFPSYSKGTESGAAVRFFSTLVPGSCEKIKDILFKALPEDVKTNFYIKYEDNVKYLNGIDVKSSSEGLLVFYIDDVQNHVPVHEIGPYGFNDSFWNIEKYDDNDDTTNDDIFREYIFRDYTINPESEDPASLRKIRPLPMAETIKTGITLSARDLSGNGRELEVIFPVLKTNIDIFVLEQKNKIKNIK